LIGFGFAFNILQIDKFGHGWVSENMVAAAYARKTKSKRLDEFAEVVE
jgi:hypothetical protein